MIMIEQTLFGLPWAFVGAILPFYDVEFSSHFQWSNWSLWVLILLSFITARIAGMAFNRITDRHIDKANPRTKDRVLPSGEASLLQVSLIGWGSLIAFIYFCSQINPVCAAFAPLMAFLLWAYAYTKRFTALCHFVMGLISACAPFFSWVAITGEFALPPLFLGLSVLCSIAANDVIYSLQDMEYDRVRGLHSIPVAIGGRSSVLLARCLHGASFSMLAMAGFFLPFNPIFFSGVVFVGGVLVYCHRFVSLSEAKMLDKSFMMSNSLSAVVLMLFSIGGLFCQELF